MTERPKRKKPKEAKHISEPRGQETLETEGTYKLESPEPSEGETPVAFAGIEAYIASDAVGVGPAVGSEVDFPAADVVTYSDYLDYEELDAVEVRAGTLGPEGEVYDAGHQGCETLRVRRCRSPGGPCVCVMAAMTLTDLPGLVCHIVTIINTTKTWTEAEPSRHVVWGSRRHPELHRANLAGTDFEAQIPEN